MKILFLYYSKTGHTLEAVNAVAEGVRAAGSEADILVVADFHAGVLANYNGLILGSPCYAGSITSGGVAKVVRLAIQSLPPDCLTGKRCGGVSVHAKIGGDTTVKTLGRLLSEKGCDDYRPGPAVKAGVPFSGRIGPSVGPQDEELFRAFGSEFVNKSKGA